MRTILRIAPTAAVAGLLVLVFRAPLPLADSYAPLFRVVEVAPRAAAPCGDDGFPIEDSFRLGADDRLAVGHLGGPEACVAPISGFEIAYAAPTGSEGPAAVLGFLPVIPETGLPFTDTVPFAVSPMFPQSPGLAVYTYTSPLVVQEVDRVAQPAPGPLGIEVTAGSQGMVDLAYGVTGLTCTQCMAWDRGDGYVPFPIPGVIAAHRTSGDPSTSELRVLQQILRVGLFETPVAELEQFVQSFTVPERCEVRRIDVTLNPPSATCYTWTASLAIVDAAGAGAPPAGPLIITDTIDLEPLGDTQTYGPSWIGGDFRESWFLEPGQRYFLLAELKGPWSLGMDRRPDNWPGGSFFRREGTEGEFEEFPDRDLAFRLIGTPRGAVSVGEPHPDLPSLQVSAGPSPFRESARVAWIDAGEGSVALAVFDAAGRRVRETTRPAAEGSWTWDARRDSGTRATPGVYFVRVSAPDGRVGSRKLVLVR